MFYEDLEDLQMTTFGCTVSSRPASDHAHLRISTVIQKEFGTFFKTCAANETNKIIIIKLWGKIGSTVLL